jgi:tetratricopeptide (TPR) repeat protein
MKGHALGMLFRYWEELDCCRTATELNPRYIGAWVNTGQALVKLKRYRDAIRAFNHALRIYPGYTAALVNKGIALCGLGEYHAAIDCFECAETFSIGTIRAQYWKGLALSRTGQYREAIDCLSEVVEKDNRYADAWVILSNCHFILGNLDDSVRCFMSAYNIDKKDIKDIVKKGIIMWRQGNSHEALQCMSNVFGILLR